jgi:hypothetical protein
VNIQNLIKDLILPGESYILQKKSPSTNTTEDSHGNLTLEWVNEQQLIGTFKKRKKNQFLQWEKMN